MSYRHYNLDAKLAELRTDGITVLENYLSADDVSRLSSEMNQLNQLGKFGESIQEGGDTISPLIIDDTYKKYPLTYNFFTDVFLHKIAYHYFNDYNEAHSRIGSWVKSVSHDVNDSGNHHLHWDPGLAIKALLYISDVSAEAGPFQYVKATHKLNHQHRIDTWKSNESMIDCKRICTNNAMESAVEGAGTCILFDTSISHRRGPIKENHNREVLFRIFPSPLYMRYCEGASLPLNNEELYPFKKTN